MKKYLLLIFCFVCATVKSQTTINGTITSGGIIRTYILYVPAMYNAANPTPLVFNFHGYGSNSQQQMYYGDFRGIADTANFIIVHPQGLSSGGNTGWNNFGTVASASIDLNFVSDLIDTLSAQYNINSTRIYSTGMSNGGFMSYDLACFLSSRFAAIASVTGSMMPSHVSACNPSHPLPVMQIHGTTDPTVSYNGASIGSTHIDSLVKFWVNFNNCNSTPVFTPVPNISTTDNCTAEHYVYNGGNAGSTVEFFKIINGGHSWPGSVYPVSSNTNKDFNASKEIWRFFCRYNSATGINKMEKINDVLVYPNPSNGMFNVEVEDFINTSIVIFNSLGEKITEEKLNSNSTSINISSCSKGIYFYQLKNANGIVKSGRVVVE